MKFVAIIVWEKAQAFDAANSIRQHYRAIGFNPAELLPRLGIEADMAASKKTRILQARPETHYRHLALQR